MTSIGKKRRMDRLFNKQTGTTVIVPMDHGIEGYFSELQNPHQLVETLSESGVDGFLTRPGFANTAREAFGRAGWVQRLTIRSGIAVARDAKLDLDQLLIHNVRQALRNGADAVVPTFFLGGDKEHRDLPLLGEIADTCAEIGLPLMAEVFPIGEKDSDPYDGPYSIDDMRMTVRIASEHGADMIKTWYSGSSESFKQIVDYSLVPVLIAGGPKAEKPVDVLEMVKGAMDAGAKGTTVGRKIWQSTNPGAMARAVLMIVHNGTDVTEALKVLNE